MLVVHFKPSGSLPNMQAEIDELVVGDKTRIKYLTWGRHTATNEYSDIKHVVLAGVLQYPAAQIEAMGRSAKKMGNEEAFSDDDFLQTRYGEVAQHILQAATRVRKSVNGGCYPGCHLYAIFSARKSVGIPKELLSRGIPRMPRLSDWETRFHAQGK